MLLETAIREITVSEYHKMAEVGIIQPDEKVELITGQIIRKMSPVNKRHASHVKRLNELFSFHCYKKVTVGVQDPVVILNNSEPEPDISVLKYSDNQYANGLPTEKDVILLVEVADTTLKRDKTTKLRLYASANIPEYWVVNLNDNCIEIYKKPNGKIYQQHYILINNDAIDLPFGKQLKVSDILK